MKNAINRLAWGLSIVALAGCATTSSNEGDQAEAESNGSSRPTRSAPSMQPVPQGGGSADQVAASNPISSGPGQPSEYEISPYDVLSIESYNEEKLTGESRVSAQGNISLFLLGQVHVAELTPTEAADRIEEMLKKDFIRNPDIRITVKEYHRRTVAVTGEVNKPTNVSVPPGEELSILEAISEAEGFTQHAKTGQIEVIRPGAGTEVFSLNELRNPNSKGTRFRLKPGDGIVIPRKVF